MEAAVGAARVAAGALVALVAGLAVLVVTAPTAAAHGGAGTITVLDEAPAGDLAVDYTVEIRYTLDQHPAVPATFVVSGSGPDGALVPSTPLERADAEGVYRARLDYPVAGDWTLTFQSGLPPGELDHDVVVGASGSPTTSPGDAGPTVPGASTDTTVGPGDTTGTAPPSSRLPAEPTAVSSGGNGPPAVLLWGLIGAAAVFLAGLAFAVWWVRRDRASDPAA
jgi:hypothetical protein